MDVILGFALLGLFLFLGLRYKSDSFTKQSDTRITEIIDQSAQHSMELESKIASMQDKVDSYDKMMIELQFARQAANNSVPLHHHLQELDKERLALESAHTELEEVRGKFEVSNGKQISERVRLGQVGENLLPFLTSFPYETKRVRGLFNPIDLLVFNDDEIIFVEVKTGDAKLTEKQRNIKRLIDEGKVRFEIHRLNDKGHEIK